MDKQTLLMILMPLMFVTAIGLCGWVDYNFMQGVVEAVLESKQQP